MNILLIILVVMVTALAVGVWVGLYFLVRSPSVRPDRSLEELVNLIKEEKDTAKRMEQEDALAAYARNRFKGERPRGILMGGNDDRPVQGGREYVPYGLSDGEKEVLRQFYGRDL